ncbi:tetratricopeptide repeat protein [Parasphingorhabdus sp.]|uniref:tetratricopeptide repeat protein n=1 Tax=Parasphingorhabdus sp. TaxID=2709688 RepID=UPI003A92F80A
MLALTGISGYFLSAEPEADAIAYPRVVLDFPTQGGSERTTELTETIENQLVRGLNGFGSIRIFDAQSNPPENSGYIVRLRFLEAAADLIELRLLDGSSGEILWSQELSTRNQEALKLELDKAIVALASNYGKIAQTEMSKAENNYSAGYPCLIQFDLYVRYREPEKLEPIRKCLQTSVKRFPNDAHLLSVFAFFQNLEQRPGSQSKTGASGMDFARQAEVLDHNSAAVNFAVSQSAFLAGDCATGLAWGKKALELNPLNSRISGYLGLYMIGCKYPGGERYAARALELDPNADLTIAAVVAFQMLKRGEAEAARELSLEYMASSPRDEPALQLTYILSSAILNDRKEAQRAWKTLAAHFGLPESSPPREVLGQWIVSPNLIHEIMEIFDRTGMFDK